MSLSSKSPWWATVTLGALATVQPLGVHPQEEALPGAALRSLRPSCLCRALLPLPGPPDGLPCGLLQCL